jgi:hypothetical protein
MNEEKLEKIKKEIQKYLPYHMRHHYLICKNEIKEVETDFGKLRLPICPECKKPISGNKWFQNGLSKNNDRLHMNCFFESIGASQDYKNNFYQDALLSTILSERGERWAIYLIECLGNIE